MSTLPEVEGYIESTYTAHTGSWSSPKFVRGSTLRVNGLSTGLNYGQQVLEGLKAFRAVNAPETILLFRPDRNSDRFNHSAETLSMPGVPTELFTQACQAAVAYNAAHMPDDGSLYVRPLLFGSGANIALHPPDEFKFCVFVVPVSDIVHDPNLAIRALILEEFDRTAPRGIGHAKAGGNYAPVMRWTRKAREEGFNITLHLDSATRSVIDEFSTCGFLGVQDEGNGIYRLVVPASPCILNSVTSQSIQGIARDFGWVVENRPVSYAELPNFSEVFGVGTSVGLIPIQSITRRGVTQPLNTTARHSHADNHETITYIPEGEALGGPVYKKLLTRLRAIQKGMEPDKFGWVVTVRDEDKSKASVES